MDAKRADPEGDIASQASDRVVPRAIERPGFTEGMPCAMLSYQDGIEEGLLTALVSFESSFIALAPC